MNPLQSPQRPSGAAPNRPPTPVVGTVGPAEACTPIAALTMRRPGLVAGRVTEVVTREGPAGPSVTATLRDPSGVVRLYFLGRRRIPGLVPGAALVAQGTPRLEAGQPTIWNPVYELTGPPPTPREAGTGGER